MIGTHPDLPHPLSVITPREIITTMWMERDNAELWKEEDGSCTLIADPDLGDHSLVFRFDLGPASRANPKPPREYTPTEEGTDDVERDRYHHSRRVRPEPS